MFELRDIRFSMSAGERLVLRGFIGRKDIMNAKDGKIVIHQIPKAIAKRISDYCDFEVTDNLNEWVPVNSGNYAAIERIYNDTSEPKITLEPEPMEEVVQPEVVEPVVEEPIKVEEPEVEMVEEAVPVIEEEVVEEKQPKLVAEVPTSTIYEKSEESTKEVSNTVVEEPISLMDTVKDIDLSNVPEAHFEDAAEEKAEEVADQTTVKEEPVLKNVKYQQNKPIHVNKKKHH